LAVYRDGSKESQPLSTSTEGDKAAEKQKAVPRRERLPDTRRSVTHKFNVAGHEGYITVGLYDDGRPGELFITMAKEGSTIGGLMDCFGTAVSMSLQYGVPLEVYVNKFSHTRFEPMGHTKNPDIRIAKSIVDYIFRWLGIAFLPGYREASLGLSAEAGPRQAGSGDDPDSELMPAAKKAGGQTAGPGRPNQANVATTGATAKPTGSLGAGSPGAGAKGSGANGHGPNGHGANGNSGNGSGVAGGYGPVGTSLLLRAGVIPKASLEGSVLDGPGLRSEQFATFQTDAPSCDNCGAITVRNGNCYLCHNCGNSMGCS
jgi:ribonucleoside-diphosphate reductase alpha chain